MNRDPFEIKEIYHIYNRGTDKRNIFLDQADHERFIKSLLYFNDSRPVVMGKLENKEENKVAPWKEREKFVEILAFCLMPNHYHLLIQEIKESGITNFMKKLGTGYTMYFNKRYERNGVLFQGQFKSVHVDQDSYLHHILHYIHLNPLDLSMFWRDGKMDAKRALKFLDSYLWSSYPKYTNKKFASKEWENILDRNFLEEFYSNKYQTDLIDWLDSIDLNYIQHLLLE